MSLFKQARFVRLHNATFTGHKAEVFAARYAKFLKLRQSLKDAAGTQTRHDEEGSGEWYCEHCSRPGTGNKCGVCGTVA